MGRTQDGEKASEKDGGSGYVQSLARALAVLTAFDATSPTLTISEVATKVGLDRAAARRYLLTLHSLGYVDTDERRFYLQPRVLDLGYNYLASVGFPRLLQPQLAALAARLNESCALTVLDRDEVVYVAVANPGRTLSIQLNVGNRLPAHVTAMGRVLLSALPTQQVQELLSDAPLLSYTPHTLTDADEIMARIDEVRRTGWAVGDQEVEVGVRSIAIPIHDVHGRIVAAGSVSTPASRVELSDLSTSVLSQLQESMSAMQGRIALPITATAASAR